MTWAEASTPSLRRALVALCITEITSWGVLHYAFPVLLVHLASATGWPSSLAMAAFSSGLVVAALAGCRSVGCWTGMVHAGS